MCLRRNLSVIMPVSPYRILHSYVALVPAPSCIWQYKFVHKFAGTQTLRFSACISLEDSVTRINMLKHFLFILLLGISSTVRSDPVSYELPDEEKQQLLDAHNGYRSDAVRRFGASNMGALVNLNDCDRRIPFNCDILQEWSETLATMASYRAMQCHLANEEDGLTTQEYTSIGQNLAKTLIFSGTKVVHGYINFTQIVGYWYSQHTYYSVTDNACTSSCNQFLQV